MRKVKKLLVILLVLFFVFLANAVWAGQKYSLQKSQEVLPKFSLGKLVQTCKGLVTLVSKIPQLITLNNILSPPQCHLVEFRDSYGHQYMCIAGGGATRCPCEDIYIPY